MRAAGRRFLAGAAVSGRVTSEEVRAALRAHQEVAILDVGEEAPFSKAHPLFAASLPLGRFELEVFDRIPRRNTPVVVYDNADRLADRAAGRLEELGYVNVSILDEGLAGWRGSRWGAVPGRQRSEQVVWRAGRGPQEHAFAVGSAGQGTDRRARRMSSCSTHAASRNTAR